MAAKAGPPAISGAARRSPAVAAALERSLFVIPSINGGALLRRMLPTLHLPPHTVAVLDQGSVDDTEAVCRAAGVRLVQLGRPHTYTEAGNIGARMARDLGCDFLFLSNNDIAFTTDVGAELLSEMLDDPRLGIVAPSQVIVDEKAGQRLLAYRAEWDLETMMFTHDIRSLGSDVGRLEADLCELTCAAVRMTAIDEIGFLDDDFGFYYEDADFCFRLRQAGYSCAYLPRSQIEHYTSSTFSAGLSGRKRAYMGKNVALFADKHLGVGIGRLVHAGDPERARSGVARHLPSYLRRYGLLDRTRPGLSRGAPGSAPFDYLYLDGAEIDLSNGRVRDRLSTYRGLVAGSGWGRHRLAEAGFEAVGAAPPGVEPDIFNPWAAGPRLHDGPTALWVGQGDAGASLDALLSAWPVVRVDHPGAHLVVVGSRLSGIFGHAPATVRRWHGQTIADFPEDGISFRDVTAALSDEDLASLCGGVDAVVSTGLGLDPSVIAAMACGTPAVFPAAGAGRCLAFAGALAFGGADPAAPGAAAPWRPEVDALARTLSDALAMDDAARRDLSRAALPLIRSRFTWRSTCAGLAEALAAWQEPSRVGAALRRRWEHDMDVAAGAVGETVDGATEGLSDEEVAEVRLAPRRPASPEAPSTAPAPPASQPVGRRPRRLVRAGRRAWRKARSVVHIQRQQGRRAALASLSFSLWRLSRSSLRVLLARVGLLSPRE